MDIAGKVVVITGAAGGIGQALARAFAEAGAHLALLDVDRERLTSLVQVIYREAEQEKRTPGQIFIAVTDLATEQGVQRGLEEVLAPFQEQADVLIANVGKLEAGRFEETSAEQWQRSFSVNFFSHVWTLRAILPRMQSPGHILFIGSDQASQPDAGLSPYSTAKAALHNLAKSLARELVDRGILVNALAPGMTKTPLVEQLMQGYAREFGTDSLEEAEHLEIRRRGIPLGRLGRPEEIARAALFLVTTEFSHGSILDLSGGNRRGV